MNNLFTAGITKEESFHLVFASQQLPEMIKAAVNQTSSLLYHTFLNLFFQLTGSGETTLRAFSLLFAVLTLLSVFLFASAIWSKKTALYAVLLTAINPFLFYWAFRGGPYTMLTFTITASVFFFLKKKVIGFIIATLAALYTHPVAILVMPVYFIWTLQDVAFGERKSTGKMFKGFVIILILYAPLIFFLIKNPAIITNGFSINDIPSYNLPDVYLNLLVGTNSHFLTSPATYIILILLVVRDWTQKFKKGIFLLLWFLLPTATAWLISQQLQQPFPFQLLVFSVPAATLIMASGKRVPASNMIIVVLIILFGIINYNIFTNPNHKDTAKIPKLDPNQTEIILPRTYSARYSYPSNPTSLPIAPFHLWVVST